MKICLIIPTFYPAVIYGGPTFSTLSLSEELAKSDNVKIYVSTTNANMTTRLNVQTNKFIETRKNLFVKYYNETIINRLSFPLLFGILKDIRNGDIVHIQSIFHSQTAVSLFFAVRFKKPIILSPRGQMGKWCLQKGKILKKIWLNVFVSPFLSNIVWHATSNQEKKEILDFFSKAKVEIIPNGIYVEKMQKSNILTKKEFIHKFLGREATKVNKIVVSMGRIQNKKGFDILIDSFLKVLQTYPDSYLLIAGPDEGEKDKLEKQIAKLQLQNNVFFIGNIKGQEKIDFLANADVFAMPSHNENFGNVYLESLASGTPIVASLNTPWSEIEKFNCGRWVENNIEDTANAIIDILKKDKQVLRKNSIELACEYSWTNLAQQFLDRFIK